MLNLMLSHALSMLYLCFIYALSMLYLYTIYAWAMGFYDKKMKKWSMNFGKKGRKRKKGFNWVLFGKIGKMRGFRKIRKRGCISKSPSLSHLKMRACPASQPMPYPCPVYDAPSVPRLCLGY